MENQNPPNAWISWKRDQTEMSGQNSQCGSDRVAASKGAAASQLQPIAEMQEYQQQQPNLVTVPERPQVLVGCVRLHV